MDVCNIFARFVRSLAGSFARSLALSFSLGNRNLSHVIAAGAAAAAVYVGHTLFTGSRSLDALERWVVVFLLGFLVTFPSDALKPCTTGERIRTP